VIAGGGDGALRAAAGATDDPTPGNALSDRVPLPTAPHAEGARRPGVRALAVTSGLAALVGQPSNVPVHPQPLPGVRDARPLVGDAGVQTLTYMGTLVWTGGWQMGAFGMFPEHPRPLDHGGRALKAAIRPYALKVAGIPKAMRFDPHTGEFYFAFKNDRYCPTDVDCTEIFVPHYHYGASLATCGTAHCGKWRAGVCALT